MSKVPLKAAARRVTASKTSKQITSETDATTRDEQCPMEIKSLYEFRFPEHPFEGVLSRSQIRRIHVNGVRDLKKRPIDEVAFEIQPLLMRSRFLVCGFDFDRREVCYFYTERMSDIRPITGKKEIKRLMAIPRNEWDFEARLGDFDQVGSI